MTYNSFIEKKSESSLHEVYMNSNQPITSQANFGDQLSFNSISGSNNLVSLSNNIITLPQGYEFLVRLWMGIQRSSVNSFIYGKWLYSDSSDISNVTIANIIGAGGNISSNEDSLAIIDTSNAPKSIIFKMYKSNTDTVSVLSEHTYCYIVGFKK